MICSLIVVMALAGVVYWLYVTGRLDKFLKKINKKR